MNRESSIVDAAILDAVDAARHKVSVRLVDATREKAPSSMLTDQSHSAYNCRLGHGRERKESVFCMCIVN